MLARNLSTSAMFRRSSSVEWCSEAEQSVRFFGPLPVAGKHRERAFFWRVIDLVHPVLHDVSRELIAGDADRPADMDAGETARSYLSADCSVANPQGIGRPGDGHDFRQPLEY